MESDRIEGLKVRFYTVIGRLELEKSITVTDRQLQIFEAALKNCKSEGEVAACILGNIRRFESMLVSKTAANNVISENKSTTGKGVFKGDVPYEFDKMIDKEAPLSEMAQSAATSRNVSNFRSKCRMDRKKGTRIEWRGIRRSKYILGTSSNNVLDTVKLENSGKSNRHSSPPVPLVRHNLNRLSLRRKNSDQQSARSPPIPPHRSSSTRPPNPNSKLS